MLKDTVKGSDIYYDYKVNDEKNKKLVVVFQSNGPSLNACNLLKSFERNEIDKEEYIAGLENAHSRLVYWNTFDKQNVLFITDFFLELGTWYCFDEKGEIVKKIAFFLQKFFKENGYLKKDITFMGSSKGAYGALLYSTKFDLCSKVLVAFPIVKPYYRFVNGTGSIIGYHYDHLQKYDVKLEKLDKYLRQPKFHPRITAVLGISDEQTKYFLVQSKDYKNCNFFIYENLATHSEYVANKNTTKLYKKLVDDVYSGARFKKINVITNKEYL